MKHLKLSLWTWNNISLPRVSFFFFFLSSPLTNFKLPFYSPFPDLFEPLKFIQIIYIYKKKKEKKEKEKKRKSGDRGREEERSCWKDGTGGGGREEGTLIL